MRADNPYHEPENDPTRIGCITASDLLDALKTAKGLKTYVYKKATERITKETKQRFISAAMVRGQELEAEAKHELEILSERQVKDFKPAFIKHELIEGFGASPDGCWADENTLIEIKCPENPAYHLDTVNEKIIKPEYQTQMLAQLSVMRSRGFDRCDFISYYPALRNDGSHFAVVSFVPSLEEIMELEEKVMVLNDEIEAAIEKVKAQKNATINYLRKTNGKTKK
tara:strand:+ start:1036 stop:1713 length:678 start_codon:yes stop_codon:yes gene_type:complete